MRWLVFAAEGGDLGDTAFLWMVLAPTRTAPVWPPIPRIAALVASESEFLPHPVKIVGPDASSRAGVSPALASP